MTAVGTKEDQILAAVCRSESAESWNGSGVWMLFGRVTALLIMGILPWLFGGVQPAVQVWFYTGLFVVLVVCLIHGLRLRESHCMVPLLLVPLLGAIAWVSFQLLPLSAPWHAFLSPAGAKWWSSSEEVRILGQGGLLSSAATQEEVATSSPLEGQIAEKLPQAVGVPAPSGWHPLSLFPASTTRDLAQLWIALGAVLIGAQLFNTHSAQIALCIVMAMNGACLAFFGLIQQLSWNGLLFWSIPLTGGGTPFSTYVNRNNAAGYLNMCLAGAVGWFIFEMTKAAKTAQEDLPGPADSAQQTDSLERTPATVGCCSRRVFLLGLIRNLNVSILLALICIVCISTGIVCSLSRGAWVSLGSATVFTVLTVAMTRRIGWRIAWCALPILLCGALVLWLGRSPDVGNRFDRLLSFESNVSEKRLVNWSDGLLAAREFWRVGSGAGTYRYVYPSFQQETDDVWFYHAENQYLEALVETGMIGVGLMVAALGLVLRAAWALVKQPSFTRTHAFGITALFAIASQAIHAFFDFGMYLPANMILFALLCGAVTGGAADLPRERSLRRDGRSRFRCLVGNGLRVSSPGLVCLLTCCCVGSLFATRETAAAAILEKALDGTQYENRPDEADLKQVENDIQRLSLAVQRAPNDALAQLRLADLWVRRFRLSAMQDYKEKQIAFSSRELTWQYTSTTYLHGWLRSLERDARYEDAEKVRSTGYLRANITNAIRHAYLARNACPLLGKAHARIAELGIAICRILPEDHHIEFARRLSVSKAGDLFHCGQIAYQSDSLELALDCWRGCITATPEYLDRVFSICPPETNPDWNWDRLLPDAPEKLIALTRIPLPNHQRVLLCQAIGKKAETLQAIRELSAGEGLYIAGVANLVRGHPAKGISLLFRAVGMRPGMTKWRYDLAVVLQKEGRVDEAIEQLLMCCGQDPENGAYTELLKRWSALRSGSQSS